MEYRTNGRRLAFKMYGGPSQDVTLVFGNKLIGVVQDKFGEDTGKEHLESNE